MERAAQLGAPTSGELVVLGRRVDRIHATVDDASSMLEATMITGGGDEPTRLLLERCGG